MDLLENYDKNNVEPVFQTAIVVSNSSFLVPKMAVNRYLPEMLNKFVNFLFDNTKILNPGRN